MRIKDFITVMAVAMLLTACSSEDEKDVKFSSELLKINDTSIELPKDATSRTIAIDADCDWDVTFTANEWSDLVVQRESQTSLSIQTGENPLRTDRTATLTIATKGGLKRSVNIRQAQGVAYIRTDVQTALQFDENQGDRTFQIQSNTTWGTSVSYLTGGADWLTVTTNGSGTQTVTVRAGRAVSDVERQATITITSTEAAVTASASVSVVQSGLGYIELEVSPKALNFSSLQSSEDIMIEKSNAQWWTTIVPIAPENDESWFSLSETSGIYAGSVTVTCLDNYTTERCQATIIFTSGNKNGGIPQRVNIVQAAGQKPAISGFTNAGSVENIKEPAAFTFSYESLFPVTAYGLCYSTVSEMPTIEDEHTTLSATDKTATVSVKTEALQSRKTYYVRAYATNAVGTTYSEQAIKVTTVGDAPDVDDNPPLFVPKR